MIATRATRGAEASRLSPVWPRSAAIEVSKGKGVRVFSKGRTFMDFTSGIGVTSTGHCHPEVVAAIQRQAELLLHGQPTIIQHQPIHDLAEQLSEVVPDTLGCFFFANSGGEAVESAMKLVRQATGRPNIIAFQGGYHGRGLGALSITTAKAVYRSGYQPLVAGTFVSPFPYALQWGSQDAEELSRLCLKQLELLLATSSTPDETAAMIVEPVLGEGGYVVPPKSFLRGLRRICDENEILLIGDEVQTGFGRTGRMFGFERCDAWPDVLVFAKGLGSGMPISGIAASHELMSVWRPGSHGGTYGGNPVCAAAALATLRLIRDQDLAANAARQGAILTERLGALAALNPELAEVRGLGLMVGCEFATPAGEPDPAAAQRVRDRCLDGGLILSICGTYEQVVRWSPPLTVTADEIEAAVTIFATALRAVKLPPRAGRNVTTMEGDGGPARLRRSEEVSQWSGSSPTD